MLGRMEMEWMFRGLSVITGILLGIMIFLNGTISSLSGTYVSNLLFHGVGLLVVLIIAMIHRKPWFDIRKIPILLLTPGLLSVFTTVLNNLSMNHLGITVTVGISMFGQLIASNMIDHFGFFDMPVVHFRKEKLVGFSIILVGIVVMIMI